MLVLSRKKNEEIIIGDDIIVTIVEIRGGKVRLGIKAPKDFRVDRVEVREEINRELKQEVNRELKLRRK